MCNCLNDSIFSGSRIISCTLPDRSAFCRIRYISVRAVWLGVRGGLTSPARHCCLLPLGRELLYRGNIANRLCINMPSSRIQISCLASRKCTGATIDPESYWQRIKKPRDNNKLMVVLASIVLYCTVASPWSLSISLRINHVFKFCYWYTSHSGD